MENLEIYNQLKAVPENAKKTITGGRLNGMTDIKPMWRIEKLTEVFGVCGIGWKAKIKNKEIIDGANNEKIAIVDIDLYIKIDGCWSEPIEGTGGSSFISKEKNGLYTNDECFKMAYTDALSVACKSLGMGAEVYWGDSKYNKTSEPTKEEAEKYTFKSGQHANWTLKKVIEEDTKFLDWLLNNSKDNYLLQCIELLTGEVPMTEEEQDEKLEVTLEFQQALVDSGQDLEELLDYYNKEKKENFTINELTENQKKEAIQIMNKKIEKRNK